MYTIASLLHAVIYSRVILVDPDQQIEKLVYDTRKISEGKKSLFFALVNQRDGHAFFKEAYDKGVRNFVFSKSDIQVEDYADANFIWVEDTLRAIQQIAVFHRSHFSFPVIGITGSNGKTIVKEWLYQLLSVDRKCYQSPKSYNSQLGVALSLWELNPEYDIALIEAGISQVGEMQYLQKMIRPDIGVLTSLGVAHREGFSSESEKFDEKWRLFKEASVIIAPSASVAKYIEPEKVFTWGKEDVSKVCLLEIAVARSHTTVKVLYKGEMYEFQIPFVDRASVENVMTCVTVMLYLGYSFPVIVERVQQLRPLEMRLQLKKGKRNISIIDDSYSNDLASLQIAIDFLSQQNQYANKSLILSDFSGEEWTEKFQTKLLNLLNAQFLNKLVLVGERFVLLRGLLQAEKLSFFNNTEELLQSIHSLDLSDETVLIKGARKYELEKVSKLLAEKSHETVLEIYLKALEHNLAAYRSCISKEVKLMVMVKAFSYGSGSYEVANILQFNKVDYLTVAFVDEGVELREGGIQLPIMVLSPHESSFDDLVRYQLEPEIYSLRILRAFVDFLRQRGVKDYPVHIKMDTGMHRLGFLSDEVQEVIRLVNGSSEIRVISAFSHLVGVGNPALDSFTDKQILLFRELASKLETGIGYQVIKHICNTSGIVYRPDAHMDMVRLGIGLYGVDAGDRDLKLEDVSCLKTTITQLKDLPKGETVGYDRKGILERDSTIATVKIGYADGYDRRLGNGVGKMLINGNMVPTVGNVCMDMCMLDVTGIPANEGDEVIVFPDVKQIARDIATIPYELLVGISSRVKRVYFYE